MCLALDMLKSSPLVSRFGRFPNRKCLDLDFGGLNSGADPSQAKHKTHGQKPLEYF